ncbi:partial cytosolic tryparedoxin peroxidase, trypanosomatid typical 2-Cys peroxiredoxin, partial [uncultured bacterium]
MTIAIGDTVPDFQALATGRKTIRLSDYAGQCVLLYFYPKDNTAGCTQQAQFFRDTIEQFTAHNTIVLGVS